jgi:hypothetical protein
MILPIAATFLVEANRMVQLTHTPILLVVRCNSHVARCRAPSISRWTPQVHRSPS